MTSQNNDDPLAAFPDILRWVAIVPAAFIASIVIPWLIYLIQAFGFYSPEDGSLSSGLLRLTQSGMVGFFFVFAASFIAPRFKLYTSFAFGVLLIVIMTILGTITAQNMKDLQLGYQLIHLIAAVVGGVIGVFLSKEYAEELSPAEENNSYSAKFWLLGSFLMLTAWAIFVGGGLWFVNTLKNSASQNDTVYTSQSHDFRITLPVEPEVENSEAEIDGETVSTSTYSVVSKNRGEYYVVVHDYKNLEDYDIPTSEMLDGFINRPLESSDGVVLVSKENAELDGQQARRAIYTEEKENAFNDIYVIVAKRDTKFYFVMGYDIEKSDFENLVDSFEFTKN